VIGRDLTSIIIDDAVHAVDAKDEPIAPLVADK
jgi:hypothetical protein